MLKFLRRSSHVVSILVVLGGGVAFSQQRPQQPANPSSQRATTNSPNDQSAPNITVTVNAPSNDRQTSDPNQEANNQTSNSFWNGLIAVSTALIAVFTVILAVATMGLILVGAFQWHALQGQLKATQTAAEAADTSAKVALMAQRPYVGFRHIRAFREGNVLRFDFLIINFGNSPAPVTGLVWSTGFTPDGDIPQKEAEIIPEVSKKLDMETRATGIIQPHEERPWQLEVTLSPEEWDKVNVGGPPGTERLWAVVWLRYDDRLAKATRHVTMRTQLHVAVLNTPKGQMFAYRFPPDFTRIDAD